MDEISRCDTAVDAGDCKDPSGSGWREMTCLIAFVR